MRDVHQVACRNCGVPAGMTCRTWGGQAILSGRVHGPRHDDARSEGKVTDQAPPAKHYKGGRPA